MQGVGLEHADHAQKLQDEIKMLKEEVATYEKTTTAKKEELLKREKDHKVDAK